MQIKYFSGMDWFINPKIPFVKCPNLGSWPQLYKEGPITPKDSTFSAVLQFEIFCQAPPKKSFLGI